MRCARGLFAAAAVAVSMWVIAAATPATSLRAAILAAQVDDFENRTTQSWDSGPGNTVNPATNIASGGPAGADDNFMRLASNGGLAGGKLIATNQTQWTGNYLAAHVDEIRMEVNSFIVASPPAGGQETLNLRLILFDAFDGITLSTVANVLVPPGSGWQTITFPLTAANLTGGNISTALANVTELDLVHSRINEPLFLRSSSPAVVAQLGVDNIRAVSVPEPAQLGVASIAMAAMTMRGGRGGRSRA
jgi:hypothetical protein